MSKNQSHSVLWPVAIEALKKFLVIFLILLGLFLDFLLHLLIVKVQILTGTPGKLTMTNLTFVHQTLGFAQSPLKHPYFEALFTVSTSNGSK